MSRDQRFYIADGNTTICVADTLFKVHRSILCQDGSTFEDMFSVNGVHAQPPITDEEPAIEVGEGDSDDRPIYLHGDSVDQFRDLLWSLYALPHEIVVMMSPLADILKLANIARMAHKYQFSNIEAWALDSLRRLQTEPSKPIETHSLIPVTEVAVLCDDAKLLQIVRPKWKSLIEENKDLSLAISVFERLGIRDLNGLAYHAMMLQGREKWNSDPLLTREQRIRLLSGYHVISEICANLPSNHPKFLHHDYCGFNDECQKSWELLWNGIMIAAAREKNDLFSKITCSIGVFNVLLEHPTTLIRGQLNEYCSPLALQAIHDMSRDFEAQLPDFFQDVD